MRLFSVDRPGGGYEKLRLIEAADPVPKDGEVLVRVEACGVNFADCVVRMGLYASAKEYVGWPITPGFEFSGVDADGRRVFGLTRFGGYASHVCVPSGQLFEIPKQLSMAEAAGFPTVFLTAYYALFELAQPRAGARVLVHSAAGGVGGALVQLARNAGCKSVGVVGEARKVERCLADVVVDRSRDDWTSHGPFDVVFDAAGVDTLKRGYAALKPTGRLVCYGFHSMLSGRGGKPNKLRLAWDYLRTRRFHPMELVNDNRSVMGFNLSYLFDHGELLSDAIGRLLAWLDEGKLQPPPVTTYPFEDAAAAHRDLEAGHTVGKLVLRL